MLGTFGADVKAVGDDKISVDGHEIAIVSSRDPTKLPWGAMNVDIVIEGTGVFVDEAREVFLRNCAPPTLTRRRRSA